MMDNKTKEILAEMRGIAKASESYEQENQSLRELLKECRSELNNVNGEYYHEGQFTKLIERIDNQLGSGDKDE